jgi:hypothetical protein
MRDLRQPFSKKIADRTRKLNGYLVGPGVVGARLRPGGFSEGSRPAQKKAARTVHCSCREASDATCIGLVRHIGRSTEKCGAETALRLLAYHDADAPGRLSVPLWRHGAKALRHPGIACRDAAGIVRYQRKLHAVVANVDIGMMLRFLG